MSHRTQDVIDEAIKLFYHAFHISQEMIPISKLTIALAPGRVNLIGEHTDYNDGFVFPVALDLVTVIVGIPISLTNGQYNKSTIVSTHFPNEIVTFQANTSLQPCNRMWENYLRGVTSMYLETYNLENANVVAAIATNVPMGSGLSSSASFEVAFATFLSSLYPPHFGIVENKQKAQLCQLAEHRFCHIPCGIMDQLIASCAEPKCAMFLDCRSLETIIVPFHDPEVVIVVIDTHISHEFGGETSEYAERVKQCNDVVKALNIQKKDPKITHLRDITMDDLNELKDQISDCAYRRARHVITENTRTIETIDLLRNKQYKLVGEHMYASHESLKRDYEVTIPELDDLVDIASSSPGVFGARMTGGGFGGCVIVLMNKAYTNELLLNVKTKYKRPERPRPTAFVVKEFGGKAEILHHS